MTKMLTISFMFCFFCAIVINAAAPLPKAGSCSVITNANPNILDCWLHAETSTLLFRLDASLNYDAARAACKAVVNGADLVVSTTSQMLETITRLAALRSTMGGGANEMGFWLGHTKGKVGPPPVGHVNFHVNGKFTWIGGAAFPRSIDKNLVDSDDWCNKDVCLKLLKDKHFSFVATDCAEGNSPVCAVKAT